VKDSINLSQCAENVPRMEISMLTYENSVFKFNQEETFLLGGELHYFRVPYQEWEDRIIKIKEAGFSMISTYIPWIWHEKEEGHIDLLGETTRERDLLGFVKLVEAHDMKLCVRPGHYVMSELRNAGLPDWLLEKYEEIRAQRLDGSKHPVYELVQFLHPVYLEKVKRWYQAVFELLAPHQTSRGGCIVMAQLDNEIGMFHWVTGTPDFSDSVLADFIQENNEEQGLNSSDFAAQLQEVKQQLVEENGALLNEFRFYERTYIQKYLSCLIAYAKSYGLEVPVIVNVHGFTQHDYAKRGNLYPIGLSQLKSCFGLSEVIVAGDYYLGNVVYDNVQDLYFANVITKSLQNQEQPLFSAEFQSGFQNSVPRLQPNTHDLNSRICIAQGMKAINYYMFAGGYNYEGIGIISKNHDWQAPISSRGELRPSYYLLKHLKKVIDAYQKPFLNAQPVMDTALFVDIDYFLTDYKNRENREMVEKISSDVHHGLFNSLMKYVIYENLHVEGIPKARLYELDTKQYPHLVVFSTDYMEEAVQKSLVRYIEDGGKVFLYPKVPQYDLEGKACTLLREAIGITVEHYHQQEMIRINEHADIGMHGGQKYEAVMEDVEVFAASQHQKGHVVGVTKRIGKGQAVVLGGIVDTGYDYVRDGVRSALDRIDIRPRIKVNEDVMVQCLKDGISQSEFFVINNLDDWKKQITVTYDGYQPFGDSQIEIQGREGLILPVNYQVTEDLVLLYATQELEEVTCEPDAVVCTFAMKTSRLELKYQGDYEIEGGASPFLTLEDKMRIVFRKK
jgi:beta-galactosidase